MGMMAVLSTRGFIRETGRGGKAAAQERCSMVFFGTVRGSRLFDVFCESINFVILTELSGGGLYGFRLIMPKQAKIIGLCEVVVFNLRFRHIRTTW
jgi:hypothetical protein